MSDNGEVRDAIWDARGKRSTGPFDDPCCPRLASLLNGRFDAGSGRHVGPFYRLKITTEGGRVKVNLWAGEKHDTWFYSFDGLEGLTEWIEQALREGRGDWVPPKAKERY